MLRALTVSHSRFEEMHRVNSSNPGIPEGHDEQYVVGARLSVHPSSRDALSTWIPEHHLKKTKSAKKSGGVTSGTSADELSGAELSGTEGRRRKGKK